MFRQTPEFRISLRAKGVEGVGAPLTPPPGALTTSGTAVLFGGQDVRPGSFSGLRLRGGLDLAGDGALSVEGAGFFRQVPNARPTGHGGAIG